MAQTAYVFPGQGSQYVGMGKELCEKYPAAKSIFDQADQTLGISLSQLCFAGPEDKLTETINAQPALLTMSIACLEAAREAGKALPEPAYMAGHSLGEYTALTAAGSMEFSVAVKLARERGRLMYEAGVKMPGTMAAVIALDVETLQDVCRETGAYIANLNCPGQIAISGTPEAVKAASKLAKKRGAKLAIPLQVSGAFHSPLIASAAEELAPQIDQAAICAPSVPVIGNTNAQVLDSAAAVRAELKEQVCSCVQWEATIRYLLNQGVDTFVEIGAGNVLSGLLARIAPNAKAINIGTVEDIGKLPEMR